MRKFRTILGKSVLALVGTALIAGTSLLQSCTAEPEEVLDYTDFYTGVDDVDAAILGLYGKFADLATQVVVLNELRGDLMDITPNASFDLEEINYGRPSPTNPWTNVSSFYGVIQYSNDILANLDRMLQENRLISDEYAERYADVAALRTWVYLQLGLHFGEVTYLTEPVYEQADMAAYANKVLSLDELVPELIRCMEALPTLEPYKVSTLIKDKIDGVYALAPMFINKRCLLGDLYLFNDQYVEAATQYRIVLGTNESGSNTSKYKLYGYPWTSGDKPSGYGIYYKDNRNDDMNSMYNTWREMFASTSTSGQDEWIWMVCYDKKYSTSYTTLRKLFDPANLNGQYQLRPSTYAIDSVWGKERQRNQVPFDARGLTGAFDKAGTDYVVKKYAYFDEFPSGDVAGGWWLYRAGMLHLRYAEAANRAGYPKLAWAMVNNGLSSSFEYLKPDGTRYPGDSIRIPGDSPFDLYPYPFTFDARSSEQPYIRAPWRNSSGIRGRASVEYVDFPADCASKADSIAFLEKFIIREAALELGFEGHRWEDLIRVARRLNKESAGAGDTFLWDENIKHKYDHSTSAPADLRSSDKWFLPVHY